MTQPKAKKTAKAGTSNSAAADRRARFPAAYIAAGGNATEAAKAVGCPPRSAHVRGAEFVKDRKVAAAIKRLRAVALKQAEDSALLTEREVLESLARGLRFDPRRLYNQDGALLPMRDLPDDVALELEGAEVDEIMAEGRQIGRTSKVKFPKKTAVRDQAMRYFGMFEADNAQKSVVVEIQKFVAK